MTWVLQKDLRPQYSDRFEAWWRERSAALSTSDFPFELLASIRNTVSKQGNHLPLLVGEVESELGTFYYEWDIARGKDGLVGCGFRLAPGKGPRYKPTPEGQERQLREATTEALEIVSGGLPAILSNGVHRYKYGLQKGTEPLAFDELLRVFGAYLDRLHELLLEAERTFLPVVGPPWSR